MGGAGRAVRIISFSTSTTRSTRDCLRIATAKPRAGSLRFRTVSGRAVHSESELQDRDRSDYHCQVFVSEVGLERQGRVELVAAIEQIKHLTDHQRIDGDCSGELVGRVLRFHPEERP
jgi:hypothetical protein